MKPPDRLVKYVLAPPGDEARLERQYAAVEARLAPPRRFWESPRFALACAAVAVIAIGVAVGQSRRFDARTALAPVAAPALSVAAGSALESARDAESTVTLAEGSRVTLAPSSRATFVDTSPTSIAIELDAGKVDIAASHRDGRTFVVNAHGHRVHVVGTVFSVAIDEQPERRVHVEVREGRVRVTTPQGKEQLVDAGEAWLGRIDANVAPPDEAPERLATSQAAEDEPADPVLDEPGGATRPKKRGAPAPAERARELLAQAQAARAAGRTAEAERLLDALRKRHRTDPRAPLAALELGRLRLDGKGDAKGAEEAFRDAIALGPSSPLREDAEARRVEALSRLGRADCEEAKRAYLARYPRGLHRALVAASCRPPKDTMR